MPLHSSLTGVDLHENKGVAGASNDTVAVANTGATVWQKITSANINAASVKNVNKYFTTVRFADISTAEILYVPVSQGSKLLKATLVLSTAITLANSTVTFKTLAGVSLGTGITVNFSGSAAGDVYTFTPSSNDTFATNAVLRVETDGASTTVAPVLVTLDWELT